MSPARKRKSESDSRQFVRAVRGALKSAADSEKAGPMQSYMRSAMPYRGVQAGPRRKLLSAAWRELPLSSQEAWSSAVQDLWSGAQFREERYQAIDTLLAPRFRDYRRAEGTFALLERLIVEGAWWDYVDPLAGKGVGEQLQLAPGVIRRALRRWARSKNMWKRRSAIVSQLTLKGEADRKLLYGAIEANFDYPEFFVQKAIGWALRQLAWSHPDEVERYVLENQEQLSALARREALKNQGRTRA